jgi:magnesium transporter
MPYDPGGENVAGHATMGVPIATPGATAADVRASLTGREFQSASDVAVCEGELLVGLLSIERLLATPDDIPVSAIMDPDPPTVHSETDQEVAAWKAVEHGESSLAVVDREGRFVGLVPPRRLLAVLLREHEEDIARVAGFLRGTQAARAASEESIPRRFWHKLPWLIVGLAGAILAADIVGAFEGELEKNVTLAFFIPGVVYLADAVGTQTEALVIRGLSHGVSVRHVMRKEMITGVLVGMALGFAFLPFGIWRWGDEDVAIAVSISLLAACSVATMVAMALPALFQRLGRDPAFGSGPLATVIQDLLSIVIYFAIVTAIVD